MLSATHSSLFCLALVMICTSFPYVVGSDDLGRIVALVAHAEDAALRGDYEESGLLYQLASGMELAVDDTRAANIQKSAIVMSGNLKNMSFDAMGLSQSRAYVTGADFDDLYEIIQQSIRIVQDYDKQIACLHDLQLIDQVLLVQQVAIEKSEVERHLQELKLSVSNADSLTVGLSNELVALQDKYVEFFDQLSEHIRSAVVAENQNIHDLHVEIQSIQNSARKKSIIGGIFSGLQVIGGAVACVLGAPQAGIPLIIGGVAKAVDVAADALKTLSPQERAAHEVVLCEQAILNLQSLIIDAQVMHEVWDQVTENVESGTLPDKLPQLFSLTIASESFEAYMKAFQGKIINTAGQDGVDVAVDAALLTEVVSLTVVSINEFYQAKMTADHGRMQLALYTEQASMLTDLSEEGASSVALLNHTISLIQSRRRKAAQVTIQTLSLQRRQFALYTLQSWVDATDTLAVEFMDDTLALQSASADNLQRILDYDTAQYTHPQQCWTDFAVSESSHGGLMSMMRETGTLNIFLQPPSAASLHAYDAFVSEVQAYIKFKPNTPNVPSSTVRVRISKSSGEIRLDGNAKAHRYLSAPHTLDALYDATSGCPLSATSTEATVSDVSNFVRDGRRPSLYGLWLVTPSLSTELLEQIESVTLLMSVNYKISGTSSATQFRLFAGGAGPRNGYCGAAQLRCKYGYNSFDSDQCLKAYESATYSKHGSDWGWSVAGFVLVAVLLAGMNVYVFRRINSLQSNVVLAARVVEGPVTFTPLEKMLSGAFRLEQRMRNAQEARKLIRQQRADSIVALAEMDKANQGHGI